MPGPAPLASSNTDAPRAGHDAGVLGVLERSSACIESLIVGLLGQSEDCIKILNIDGSLGFMNCGGLAAMEIDDFAEVSGRPWWELWPAELQDTVRHAFETAAAGKPTQFTARCPTAKGTVKHWSVDLKPLPTPKGDIASVLCSSHDITPTIERPAYAS